MTETASDELHVPAGTTIFRQGDPGEEMFVIARGRVRLTLGSGGHEQELSVFEAGSFFGELSLLGGAPRSATAVAVEDCVLYPIRRDVFAMMMQDDLEVVFRMMDALGVRLGQTNDQLRRLAVQVAGARCLADLLRRCLPTAGAPLRIGLEELARAWRASPEAVDSIVGDLVRQGAGVLREGCWCLEGRDQVERLVDALVRVTG